MTDFQIRLRKAMDEKSISASELSKISGVDKGSLSNYINGKYAPKQDKVFRIAKALGVDAGWLMTGDEPRQIKPMPSSMPFHPDVIKILDERITEYEEASVKKLLSLFHTMTDADKEKLLDYAGYIVDSYKRPDKRRKL